MATGIGETLRAARREQGVALSDAAAETRVRESYLAALEEENFAALGEDVYVKGFLRSYARFLRLDPEPLLDAYRREHEAPPEDVAPLAQQPAYPMPAERRSGVVVGAAVVVVVVLLFAIIGVVNDDDPPGNELVTAPEPVPTTEPATPATPATPVPRATPKPRATTEKRSRKPLPPISDAPTERLAARKVVMSLDVRGGESWMRVVVDGETRVEGIQREGASLDFRADDSIEVRLGNPGVVQVNVTGRRPGKLGKGAVPVTKTFTAKDAA